MKRIFFLLFLILSVGACTNYRAEKAFEQMKQEVRDAGLNLDSDFLSNDDAFRQTRLYKFLEYLPKGSDLHLHNSVMLGLDDYLKFLEEHPQIVICCKEDSLGYATVLPQGRAREGYKTLTEAYQSGVSYQDLKNRLTLKGRPDSVRIWDHFGLLFGRIGDYQKDDNLKEDYLFEAFTGYARHGVLHLENRQTFTGTVEQAVKTMQIFQRAQDRVRVKYPDFSIRMVLTGLKNPGYEQANLKIFENGMKVQNLVRDSLWNCEPFIAGLDFAQEEDKSYPLSDYKALVRELLKVDPSLQITLHAGESLNPDNDEIRSAINLGARRIGHAYNLYMHPELIPVIRRKDICLETCPVSNCSLGYCQDLHKHPMKENIKAGLAVTICDDDPLFQEGVSLVDDYFVAAAYWDLSLREIKRLCRNSIEYSFLSPASKKSLLKRWKADWKAYISCAYDKAPVRF